MTLGDGANPLPSWNQGSTRQAIIEFVARVTNESSAEFVSPEERVAVFDNDGTLWCEKPMYVQLDYFLRKLAAQAEEDATLRDVQPWQAAYEKQYDWLGAAVTKHYQGDDRDVHIFLEGILKVSSSLTTDEVEAQARRFIHEERHPILDRLYIECGYQPMVELIGYLAEHGFTNYIASGGGRDFMRPISLEMYGIPREQVIGSSASLRFEPDDAGGRILLLAELDFLNDGPEKPVRIWNRTGRRPILAAGNSNGDIPMLQFVEHAARPSLALLLLHDDAEREFDYVAGAERALEEAASRRWTVVSMKDDWNTVFERGDQTQHSDVASTTSVTKRP